ncbi:hypothetical protein BSL78_16767 [Apostichopus japonicus]|uniref:Uncharacterized protein n=1 Tax=Stichopus japonicus TaxID=307972 RepID=A0A2G8KEF8_STIJA|nr:hypothetical protein BSL78_16767 [Apostichopus japonicus]
MVQELQQRLIGDTKLFESLVWFLGNHSLLLAYSACKLLVAFLIHDAARLSKLKYLIHSCLETSSINKDYHYHQILLTFDLFRLLCKNPQIKESKNCCSCGEVQNTIWVNHADDMLEAMSCFVSLLRPFQFFSVEKRDSNCDVDAIASDLLSQEMKGFTNFQPRELEMLLISFLKMVKSFVKRSNKDKCRPFWFTIVDFLLNLLEKGLFNTRHSLRISLDILATVLQSRPKKDSVVLHAPLVQTARSICELINREWLNKLPCSTDPVGFGGFHFTESCPDQMRDLILLRKVTKLIFMSVQLMTEHDQGEKILHLQWSASSLGHLKTSIESLKLDSLSEFRSDWIIQLFADEDEMMVSVLFIALKTYNQIIKTFSFPDIATVPAWCELKHLLCPHLLFWNYLKLLDFDHSVLLDFLISSETNFLQYLTAYLHLMKCEWDKCCDVFMISSNSMHEITEHVSEVDYEEPEVPPKRIKKIANPPSNSDVTSCNYSEGDVTLNPAVNEPADSINSFGCHKEPNSRKDIETRNDGIKTDCEKVEINSGLDQVLSVLIRLRMSLERLQKRNMFPYSISPLIRSLLELEALYEQ